MPGTGLLPPSPPLPLPHVHPWAFPLWAACKLMLPWFALVLTLASLAMLNWFVVTELRTMRMSMGQMYGSITHNQQDILVRLERIETRWERFDRDRDGKGRDGGDER